MASQTQAEDLKPSTTSTELPQAGAKLGCIFCNIGEEKGFKIVLQEGNVVVFKDPSPSAQQHLLVTPLNHIDGVKELSAAHVPLIQEMEAAGHRALDKLSDAYPPEKRM